MTKRYAIWNKSDAIIVPTGAVYSAEQWMTKYPMFKLDRIVPVCSVGEINGGFVGTLGQMVQTYKDHIDFSACETNEDKLAAIEAFEDAMNAPSTEPSVEERTAAALEFLAMNSLPDEEV